MAHGPRNDSAIELLFYPKALAGFLLRKMGIPWWKGAPCACDGALGAQAAAA